MVMFGFMAARGFCKMVLFIKLSHLL